MNSYYVYILTNKRRGVLYTGVTNNLKRRTWEHKNKLVKGFTSKYNLTMLVYFESTSSAYAAIEREKRIKAWKRKWKIEMIEKLNVSWNDLYYTL